MGQTGLHLHVSLEDRQNLNADAIQGELLLLLPAILCFYMLR